MSRANYYDYVKDHIKVIYLDESERSMFGDANEDPENWVILVDGDVDAVTVFDKVNKIAYEESIKGYELLTANLVGNVDVEYSYIEEYVENLLDITIM